MSRRLLPMAILPAMLTFAFMARSVAAGEPATYKIGSKIAEFAFRSDQGKIVKLSDYRGKAVVLTMFATW